MSSTNKTDNYGLNKWIGSDKPERNDFNRDNEIIDTLLFDHLTNPYCHAVESEKEKWNNYMHVGIYFGNGTSRRNIATQCPFKASFGIIFADSRPMSVVRFSENKKYNYTAFFAADANSLGVTMADDGKSFEVTQSSSAEISNEYMNLNENGVGYQYIMFR